MQTYWPHWTIDIVVHSCHFVRYWNWIPSSLLSFHCSLMVRQQRITIKIIRSLIRFDNFDRTLNIGRRFHWWFLPFNSIIRLILMEKLGCFHLLELLKIRFSLTSWVFPRLSFAVSLIDDYFGSFLAYAVLRHD